MSTFRIDRLSPYTRDEAAEKREQLNAVAKANWDDPAWRREMAGVMTTAINYGFESESLLDMTMEHDSVAYDDRVTISEKRGLKAMWIARGGRAEESSIVEDVMEIGRDTLAIAVSEHEDKLRLNFADTSSTLIDLATKRLNSTLNYRVLSVFQAAVGTGDATYSSGAGLNLGVINSAIRSVFEWTETGKVTIMGRPTMIQGLLDALTLNANGQPIGYLPQTNETLVSRGSVGLYRGANLVELRNFRDDTRTSLFPANELFIFSSDCGKSASYGGVRSSEWVEQGGEHWHYQAKADFGFAVTWPDRLWRIRDTSVTVS